MRCIYLMIMGLTLIFLWSASGTDKGDYCSEGNKLLAQKDYPGAEKAFEQALSLDGSYTDAQLGKCKAIAAQGDCDKASDCYDTLHKLDKPNKFHDIIIAALKNPDCFQYTHGSGEYASSSYNTLLSIYNDSIASDRNDTKAWNGKGVALGELNRLDESMACFDEVIRISNSSAEVAAALNNVGVSLDKLERHSEALEAYNRSIKIDPRLAEAWYNKGITLSLNDEFEAGHECYLKAWNINPMINGEMLDWIYKET